ncbi:MAG: GNAT family N-acetyltransferase [Patescibacteria group bacterium]|jgi:GNAT superfamily N-acetyltransferase
MITIKEINSPAEVKEFVKFPWRIYRDDAYWVAPLIRDQINFFNPEKNPFYQHSRVQLIMAYENGRPVGRLSVHENTLHVKRHEEPVGFFGFFECVNDYTVAKAMFDYAKKWLKEKNYCIMRGPANFTINGEYALLVDGFDQSPMIMMTYNPPYYSKLLEQYGFISAQDMYAFSKSCIEPLPANVLSMASEVEKNYPDLVVRKADLSDLKNEIKIVHQIYAQAWDKNWGATPMSEDEILKLADDLKHILDPDIAFIMEYRGQPIGFSLSIPNANEALKSANGRLFPLGLLKILWKKRQIKTFRVLVMGVLEEHRHLGFDTVFYKKTWEQTKKKGYQWAEMSLINESNIPMRRVLEWLGAKIYKTYRMYDSHL